MPLIEETQDPQEPPSSLTPDPFPPPADPWWQHDSYTILPDDILLDGYSLRDLAREHGTPLYLYSQATVQRQLRRMQAALQQAVPRHKIYYAMKSNRNPAILSAVRALGDVGIDTCSPREVRHAMSHGFEASEISFNAGMLSNRDLDQLLDAGVHCTLDTFSAIRRYGAKAPKGTRIGLRFNPAIHAGYGDNPRLSYGQAKFGFEAHDAEEALAAATRAGLIVDSVHMHLGWGLPQKSQGLITEAFARLATVASKMPHLETINVGGGLGGRYIRADAPLLLESWSEMIHQHFAPLDKTIICEPGTFVVAPAGVLLLEVNTLEHRRQRTWLGVDAGFAVNLNPALYGIPLTAVLLRQPLAEATESYTIAGNINEAGDIWSPEQLLPPLQEGDILAFLPAGAYGSSMSSDHCLRGQAKEIGLSPLV
jgi:diaminopimelate decarboxylase